MMFIKSKYTEYTEPQYTLSYDSKFDILRISNSDHDSYSFEELTDHILLMIDDETEQVTGLEVYDLTDAGDIVQTLEINGYEFTAKACERIIKHLRKSKIIK